MAIIGPEQLPAICHYASDPVKFEVLSTLGHPTVLVELTEPQLEQAIRVTGDFIAQYFPFVEKYAYFQAQPLVSTYDIPADAYWIKDVKWDPATTRIGDIFGAECCDCSVYIDTINGSKLAGDMKEGDEVWSYNESTGKLEKDIIEIRKESGEKDCFEVKTECGLTVRTSEKHKYLTEDGWLILKNLTIGKKLRCYKNGITYLSAIKSINNIGSRQTIDFQIKNNRNFIGNGIIIHNSFLFCYSGGTKILSDKGPVVSEEFYKRDHKRIITPFGIRKPRMRWNKKKQDIIILRTKNDFLICTPNHPISCNERMIPAHNCKLGDKLISSKDKQVEIIGKEKSTTVGTWSIQSPNGGLYVGSLGREFYLSH